MRLPGDPTPRSANEVIADRSYKVVVTNQSPSLGGPLMCTLIVLHCGTEMYWETVYPASQPGAATMWHRVEPVVETRTIYRPVA